MNHKYYFSIASMFKNESWGLKEWIDHNRFHGVDHIYLINDFSEDNTFDKAKEIFRNHKNFKIYDNNKKGLGGAVNLGIDKSSGAKICIMMADLSDDKF